MAVQLAEGSLTASESPQSDGVSKYLGFRSISSDGLSLTYEITTCEGQLAFRSYWTLTFSPDT